MGLLRLPVFLLLLLVGPVTCAAAADAAVADESASLYTLSPVVVRASSSEPGTATIGADELQLMPSTTGAVTEALKGMSQVQYDYDQQSSLTLGEITPPRISISGARPYENNFTIDGMSISNSINPSGFDNNVSYTELLPGGADVNIFYDTSLIDSVTLHSSNIPAQYGGFLGGVVDARLRDPQTDRWRFRVSGRYTEDSWFELRGVDRESDTPTNQPRFTVYDTSATAEGPLDDRAALLLSFSRRHSVIPLKRDLGAGPLTDDEQKRTNENYFARLALTPAADLDISFDATYAPYEEFRWRVDWPESEWKNENRSWRFAHQTDYSTSAGVLTAKLAYTQNRFRRDSVSNLTSVITDLRDPSQNDRRGAIGDAEVENRDVGATVSFMSEDHHNGALRWNVTTGLEYGYKQSDAWNEAAILSTVIRYAADDRLNRESTSFLYQYEEVAQSHHMATYGAHLQSELHWHRLLVRPGVRLDYDNFSSNADLAPRFKAVYDTFADGSFRLIGGVNRYYGQQLRAYAFNRYRPVEQLRTTRLNDGTISEVYTPGSTRNYSSDDLKTPYSDEVTAGVAGSAGGFDYAVEMVQRWHKKQLVSQKDGDEYFLTNRGEGRFEGITLTLARLVQTAGFGRHRFALSATKSKTRTLNGSYFSDFNLEQIVSGYLYDFDQVFYNGSLIDRADLPAENFNAPLIVALTVSSSFHHDRLRFYAVTRWRDSADGLVADLRTTDATPYGTTSGSATVASSRWINPAGGYSDAYKQDRISGGVVSDLTVELDAWRKEDNNLTLIAEVVNLFNSKMETGVAEAGTATYGRGFYAGLRMTF